MQLSSTPLISEVEALDTHDPVILALQCAWIDEGPARDAAIAKLSESLGGDEELCRKLIGDACAAYMCWHWAENMQAKLDNERNRFRLGNGWCRECQVRHSVDVMRRRRNERARDAMRRRRNEYERDARAIVAHMIALTDL